jgi:hypothetical protein
MSGIWYDGFEDRAQCQAGASDGVRVTLRAVEGLVGQALCLPAMALVVPRSPGGCSCVGPWRVHPGRNHLPLHEATPEWQSLCESHRQRRRLTHWSYILHSHGHRLVLKVAAGLQPPPGGLVFVWPGALPASPALLNGTPVSWQGAELRIDQLPAKVSVGD